MNPKNILVAILCVLVLLALINGSGILAQAPSGELAATRPSVEEQIQLLQAKCAEVLELKQIMLQQAATLETGVQIWNQDGDGWETSGNAQPMPLRAGHGRITLREPRLVLLSASGMMRHKGENAVIHLGFFVNNTVTGAPYKRVGKTDSFTAEYEVEFNFSNVVSLPAGLYDISIGPTRDGDNGNWVLKRGRIVCTVLPGLPPTTRPTNP
jgi:hypothetical protein